MTLTQLTTRATFRALFGVAFFFIVFAIAAPSVSADHATSITSTTTVDVRIYKKIDGVNNGFSEDQFSFHLSGNGIDDTLTHDSVVSLEPGTYTVEELVPDGLVKEDWRVGWFGIGCTEGGENDQYIGSITIEPDDVGHFLTPLECEVNNQYRPESDNERNNEEQKHLLDGFVWHDADKDGIIDEDEEFLEDWTITLTNGTTTFTTKSDSDGYYSFEVTEGTWTLSQTTQSGWIQVFPTPTSYTVNVPEDLDETDQEDPTFSFFLDLFFTAAHAQVAGGSFDFGNAFDPTCSFSASETSVSASTTVTLTWKMTDADAVHIDNGIGTTTASGTADVLITEDTDFVLTAFYGNRSATCPLSVNISSNDSGGGYSQGSYGGGGGYSQGSYGGGGGYSQGSYGGGSGGSAPEPEVLGEQVDAVPDGAPNTGAGGTASDRLLPLFVSLLLALMLGIATISRIRVGIKE